MPNDAAVQLINAVKERGVVHCGTPHDLAAPYKIRELKKTKELIDVLSGYWGLNVQIENFFTELEAGISSATPIEGFDIRPDRPLIAVTCSYVWDRSLTPDHLGASIAPETVAFHLFEVVESSTRINVAGASCAP